jgi:hypothetical protein
VDSSVIIIQDLEFRGVTGTGVAFVAVLDGQQKVGRGYNAVLGLFFLFSFTTKKSD